MVAVAMDRMQFNPFTGVDPAKKKINLEEIMNFGEQKEVYYMPEHNKYTKRILGEAQKYKDFRLFQLRRTELRPQPPGVCPTLTANMGAGGHNVPFIIDGQRLRKLTENECLKLQGFVADSFKWGECAIGPQIQIDWECCISDDFGEDRCVGQEYVGEVWQCILIGILIQ